VSQNQVIAGGGLMNLFDPTVDIEFFE